MLNQIQIMILDFMSDGDYFDAFDVLYANFQHEEVDSSIESLLEMGYVRMDRTLCNYRKLALIRKGKDYTISRRQQLL